MKSTALAVLAALSGHALAQFDFCSDAGVQIAEQIILGLGPLYGTQSCYSLLNVPQTTVSTTVTRTIVSRPTGTTTITTSTGASTLTITSTSSTTVTTSTPSATGTTTTFSLVGANQRRDPQRDAKNKGGAAPTGTVKSEACSCILGPDPTQTISQTVTVSATTTISALSTVTSTSVTGTVTSTSTVVSTTTTTTANGQATATITVDFSRVVSGNHTGYFGQSAFAATNLRGCLLGCAADAGCNFVFAAQQQTQYTCVKSIASYDQSKINPNDNTVILGRGYNRGGSTRSKRSSPADLFDRRSFNPNVVVKNKKRQSAE